MIALMQREFQFGAQTCKASIVSLDSLEDVGGGTTVYVSDRNTERFLPGDVADDHSIKLQSGEGSKSWLTLERILSRLLEAEMTRSDTVVGIGGGVLCDVAAFAASLYMRGCNLILYPTTLLAMVDASLGGKTGINFGGYKNMIGSFYPASEVRICPETLATLSDAEFKSGLAEVIKTAMLGDAELLDMLESRRDEVVSRDPDLLRDIVWRCVLVKGSIVERDLRETGERAFLNLGHTFGHALESVQGLGTWSHGEAVAWGIARAMELGEREGVTSPAHADRARSILALYEYRTDAMPSAATALKDAMRRDKKRRDGDVRFVLQRDLGETFVRTVDPANLDAVLLGPGV